MKKTASITQAYDWNALARCYDALTKLRPYIEMVNMVTRQAETADGPILDAGCGTGNIFTRLHYCPSLSQTSIVGMDASTVMLAQAKQKYTRSRTVLVQGDLDASLPFPDNSFGCVVCVNVLYAVANPASTLSELYRVLRRGGKLIVVTPKAGYENGLILRAHCRSRKPKHYWHNVHRSPHRERRLVYEALTENGLRRSFLQLARHNREIARNRAFHFFTTTALTAAVTEAGFQVLQTKATYAEQNALLIARHN